MEWDESDEKAPFSISQLTPIQLASKNGHLEVVQLLHDSGADVRRCNENGASPFSLAFRAGHATVVSFLRSCGIREDVLNGRNMPAPKPQRKRCKRATPMRERARRAGVLERGALRWYAQLLRQGYCSVS